MADLKYGTLEDMGEPQEFIMHDFVHEAVERAADFQDMHGRNLFKRNMLPFDAEHANPKKLEELGYVVDIQREHRGECTHYKMRLLKIVDTEEYSIKYNVEII